VFTDEPTPEFLTYGYVQAAATIPCGDSWRDFLPAYEQSLADDAVDVRTRLVWSDSDEDAQDLAECARQDEITLAELSEVAAPFAAAGASC
jgi:hypothetical protein